MIMIDRNKLKAAARFAATDPKDMRLTLHGVLVGDGSGLVYLTADVVGVIMPTRSGGLAVADCVWAQK